MVQKPTLEVKMSRDIVAFAHDGARFDGEEPGDAVVRVGVRAHVFGCTGVQYRRVAPLDPGCVVVVTREDEVEVPVEASMDLFEVDGL